MIFNLIYKVMLLFLNGALKRFVKSERKIIHYFQIWCIYTGDFFCRNNRSKIIRIGNFLSWKNDDIFYIFYQIKVKKVALSNGESLKITTTVPLIKKYYAERGIWGPNFLVNLQDMLLNLFQVRYTYSKIC